MKNKLYNSVRFSIKSVMDDCWTGLNTPAPVDRTVILQIHGRINTELDSMYRLILVPICNEIYELDS